MNWRSLTGGGVLEGMDWRGRTEGGRLEHPALLGLIETVVSFILAVRLYNLGGVP